MEHPQLIQSAFVSYLSSISPSPWGADLTGDGGLRIFAGEDGGLKDGTRIVCAVTGDLTEQPQFSGNRFADVEISLATPVSDDGGDSLAMHRANADALQAAMCDTGLLAGLQSSALFVYQVLDKNPFQNETENGWESGWRVRVYSVMN